MKKATTSASKRSTPTAAAQKASAQHRPAHGRRLLAYPIDAPESAPGESTALSGGRRARARPPPSRALSEHSPQRPQQQTPSSPRGGLCFALPPDREQRPERPAREGKEVADTDASSALPPCLESASTLERGVSGASRDGKHSTPLESSTGASSSKLGASTAPAASAASSAAGKSLPAAQCKTRVSEQ